MRTTRSICALAAAFAASALWAPAAGSATILESAGQPSTEPSGRGAARPSSGSAVSLSALRERAAGVLLDLTASPNAQIRANAVEGLEAMPARLESVVALAVLDDNLGVRSVALMVGGRHRIRAIAPAARLGVRDDSPFVRGAALYALKRLGEEPDLTPLATMLMEDPEPRVRAHAAFILGEIGEASALSMLRHAAGRPMPRASEASVQLMRLQIAEAMVKLGDEGQIHSLHAALFPSRPDDLEAAALAAQILGEVNARRSIPDLINLAVATDERGNPMPAEVRLAAARSVARLGRRDGDFIAREYSTNPSPVIRAQVASVYADTLDRGELGTLEAMLDDPEPLVQVAAAAGLLRAIERVSGR